jgi:hypothetical protein
MIQTRNGSANSVRNSHYSPRNSYSSPVLAVGFDGGFGSAKLVTPNARIACPSYFLPIDPNDIYELPLRPDGAMVEYLDGKAINLCHKAFLIGSHAIKRAPNDVYQVVGNRSGKIDFGLQMLLGAIAASDPKEDLTIALIASIQDAKAVGDRLKRSLAGDHKIRINGGKVITVNVQPLGVVEEGLGAAYEWRRQRSEISVHDSSIASVDFGTGTTIVSVWDGGSLTNRRVIPGGTNKLIEAIANNLDFRKHLSGHPAKRHLIRTGIERCDFKYGKTGFNFKSIYQLEGRKWLKQTIAEVENALAARREEIEEIIAIGGGSLMPGLEKQIREKGYQPIENPVFANAIGLQALASLKLKKEG